MREEIWKDVEGFSSYQVSNLGRVKNKITSRILKPGLGGAGYLTVTLYKNKKGVSTNVHELVSAAFLGRKPEGYTVNHIDGNKTSNVVKNLEYLTYAQNLQHAYKNKLNNHQKSVRIVETQETFASLRECADAIGGDSADISYCLSGKLKSHKGLHFEHVTEKEQKFKGKPFLYDYQMDAVNKLDDGCILCGSVGSGKSRTGLYYYFKENGGWIDENGYIDMKNPRNLYIITTAKKRDSCEFEKELCNFLMSTNPEVNYYNNKIVIDSWNNITKYSDVTGGFFLLDEQRLVSNGAWVKAFLKIAKNNRWILLTATPADTYNDYLPVFIANGFFKNRTEFNREHVIYSRFTKYPKIERYINTRRLDRLRDRVLVQMNYKHQINTHHEDVYCTYDISKYKDVMRNRWDPYKNEPIQQASGLCYTLRRVVNSDESRQTRLLEILENHPRVIIFYNFNHELDILRNIYYGDDVEVAEYNGQKHQPIPDSEKWVYLCQYTSACEGWECTKTNCIVFYSQNYSYKVMTQAAGRVDRLNTPYTDLYYYHLKTRSGIDLAISKALSEKRKFNERKFVKW